MSTTIKCPQCGSPVEITEAIKKELEDKILQESEAKHKNEIEALKSNQDELLKRKELEIEKVKVEALENARKDAIEKVRKEYDSKIQLTKEESESREKQNSELQKQLSDMMKQMRELKDAESKLKLEYEKRMLDEQEAIKHKAQTEAEESMKLKLFEKDKMLDDMKKQVEEMRRKAEQGSQQMQGEVLELELEKMLRENFPMDEIKEVPKGIRGADVVQVVRTRGGVLCGTIIWESKNTKMWSPSWVQKLVEDQRTLKAEIAVLVTSVLPEGIRTFGRVDKVWVTEFSTAFSLVSALRQNLIDIQNVKDVEKGKESKAEVVYNYLTSNEFKQRIEVWVEYFNARREEINKERMYFNKKWEKEEKSILNVVQNTAGIYGDLQGLIGNALPTIKYLELSEE